MSVTQIWVRLLVSNKHKSLSYPSLILSKNKLGSYDDVMLKGKGRNLYRLPDFLRRVILTDN